MGFPQVSFGGQFTTMGDPALFTFRDNRDFEFYDNVSLAHGQRTRSSSAGTSMHFNFQPVNPNGARGIFSFTPRWTSSAPGLADGNAFADFLLGDPTTAQVGLGRAAMDANTNWAHFYIQDNWQVTPNLKLDFGIRYEYNQNMTDANNQIAAIDPSVPGGRFVIASDGVREYFSGGERSAAVPADSLRHVRRGWVEQQSAGVRGLCALRRAPGLRGALPGIRRPSCAAGFGIYPNQAAYSIVTNLAQNLPFFVTKTVNSVRRRSAQLLPPRMR